MEETPRPYRDLDPESNGGFLDSLRSLGMTRVVIASAVEESAVLRAPVLPPRASACNQLHTDLCATVGPAAYTRIISSSRFPNGSYT